MMDRTKMTRREARKATDQFYRELKEMSNLEVALELEEKVKQLPKAVRVTMFFDEMRRVRKLPKAQRKQWIDDYMALEKQRQAKRN